MRVDQCVSAVRAVELPVLVYVYSNCNHAIEVRTVRFARLALKVVMQNDGGFVEVIQLYTAMLHCSKCIFVPSVFKQYVLLDQNRITESVITGDKQFAVWVEKWPHREAKLSVAHAQSVPNTQPENISRLPVPCYFRISCGSASHCSHWVQDIMKGSDSRKTFLANEDD